MGYEDREYFRKEERPGMKRVSVGPITRALLFALPILYFAVGFSVDELGETGKKAAIAEGMRDLVLQGWALIPSAGLGPAPWQILSAPLIQTDLISVLVTCLVSIWFVGSQLEKLMKPRDYLIFLAACAVLPFIPAALIDPLLVEHPVSMGTAPLGMALLFAASRLLGKTPAFFGLRTSTIVWVIFALNVGFAWFSYREARIPFDAELLIKPIDSVPALLSAAAIGWFGMNWMMKRGRVVLAAEEKEDDHIAYARQFRVDEDAPSAGRQAEDVKLREREARERKRENDEQERVDALLDRISTSGISSLSAKEKRFLERISKKKKGGGL